MGIQLGDLVPHPAWIQQAIQRTAERSALIDAIVAAQRRGHIERTPRAPEDIASDTQILANWKAATESAERAGVIPDDLIDPDDFAALTVRTHDASWAWDETEDDHRDRVLGVGLATVVFPRVDRQEAGS